jgi:hypothetical protein
MSDIPLLDAFVHLYGLDDPNRPRLTAREFEYAVRQFAAKLANVDLPDAKTVMLYAGKVGPGAQELR